MGNSNRSSYSKQKCSELDNLVEGNLYAIHLVDENHNPILLEENDPPTWAAYVVASTEKEAWGKFIMDTEYYGLSANKSFNPLGSTIERVLLDGLAIRIFKEKKTE